VPPNSSTSSTPAGKTEVSKDGPAALFWAAIVGVSLFVAIVYGVVFKSTYRQTIDAAGGIVLFLLAFLTVLAALGLVKLVSRVLGRS
jgi:hypothetical protein